MNILIRFLQNLLFECLSQDIILFMSMRVVLLLVACSIDYFSQNAHETAHNPLQKGKYCLQKDNQPCGQVFPVTEVVDLQQPVAYFFMIRFT